MNWTLSHRADKEALPLQFFGRDSVLRFSEKENKRSRQEIVRQSL
jgi:hypothetical protein